MKLKLRDITPFKRLDDVKEEFLFRRDKKDEEIGELWKQLFEEAENYLVEEEVKEEVPEVMQKLDALKEEMIGVSDALDEIPSDIVKKWIENLNQIGNAYLDDN